MQARLAPQAGTASREPRDISVFQEPWAERVLAGPTACRAQQGSQAQPASRGASATTGSSVRPGQLGQLVSSEWQVFRAILAWRVGMGQWVLRGQAQSMGHPECLVLRAPSDRWAHQEHQEHPVHRAGQARTEPMAVTVRLVRQGCLPCTDTGRISGAHVLSCRTSKRAGAGAQPIGGGRDAERREGFAAAGEWVGSFWVLVALVWASGLMWKVKHACVCYWEILFAILLFV